MTLPPRPTSPLLAAETQWLFTEAELLRTPSALDGMPPQQERENRAKGVNFITQAGIMLKLPQLTLAVASVFLHRFFMRYSMVEGPGRVGFHYYAIAATSLFLATKVEENCRKMRELVIACCRVAQKNPSLLIDEQSKEYWRWRDTILHNEDVLLEAICFDLSLEPPYKVLFSYLNFFGEQDNKKLRNAGWAFLNDSNMTMLCLLFPTRTIAAAALYCAAKHCNVSFPDDPSTGKPWWTVLSVSIRDIRRACNHMAQVYENSPLKHSDNVYSRTPEDGDEKFARTRKRGDGPPPEAVGSPEIHQSGRRSSKGSGTASPRTGDKRERTETMNGTASQERHHPAMRAGEGVNERGPKRARTEERVTNGTSTDLSTAAPPVSVPIPPPPPPPPPTSSVLPPPSASLPPRPPPAARPSMPAHGPARSSASTTRKTSNTAINGSALVRRDRDKDTSREADPDLSEEGELES
ncbi:MAG: hypothetical protein M1817_003033 [Caeruleum heppii]|nr:MAG: hypothetical protein M1817_003033 [Caeruleum heppii]